MQPMTHVMQSWLPATRLDPMLIRVLIAAIFAGVLSGIFATAIQSYKVIPLILEAERYENDGGNAAHQHSNGGEVEATSGKSDKGAASEPWAPADGMERLAYTGLANIMAGVAFALILTAAALVLNQVLTVKSGLAWGIAGFMVFVLAPNFGLPPELPGMQSAALMQRQIWWTATVACTAIGLGIFAFRQDWVWIIAGLILIILPHLYGAPQPLSHESVVPAHLAAEFVMATLVTSLVYWLFLGGLLGLLFGQAMKHEIREN